MNELIPSSLLVKFTGECTGCVGETGQEPTFCCCCCFINALLFDCIVDTTEIEAILKLSSVNFYSMRCSDWLKLKILALCVRKYWLYAVLWLIYVTY